MNEVIALVNVLFLAFLSYRLWQKEDSSLKKFFWSALILKMVAGVCLGLLYTYYYSTGDTFNYFNDGVKIANLAKNGFAGFIAFLWSSDDSSPIWAELIYKQPRAMFLSKFTSLFCLVTANNYWITSLYFSFIAFFCTWLLAKKIVALYPSTTVAVLISFLFFPTVVFWSAGIIKESIAMASLYCLTLTFIKVWNKESIHIQQWILTLISIWLIWNLKYYYLAIFGPVVITTLSWRLILSKLNVNDVKIRIAIWLVIFALPLLSITLLHPNFYPERFLEVIVSSYHEYTAISSPEDLIHYSSLEPTLTSVLLNIPVAIFSGLYRPFIVEAKTSLQLLVSFENLFMLVLSISALTNLKKFITKRHRVLLLSIFVYAMLLCTFLALSTPNFGTLSRYRIGFLPFFLFLITIDNPLVHKIMNLKPLRNLVR